MSNKQIQAFKDALQNKLDKTSLVPSELICKNFTNPRDPRQPWSFKDHEFQIDITDVPFSKREMACRKPGQVGLSTIQVRIILMFVAVNDNTKGVYTLPTAAFSREFVTSRVDTAIESSPMVSALVSNDADNTSMKRIGNSFLLFRGTSGTTAAISQDLDLIISDEVDFSDQTVLGSFESRLQHSDLKLRRDFSTPTLPGYGISAKFDDSSQAYRLVRHDHCGKWVELDFYNDIIIPGFDKAIAEFRSEHLFQVDVGQAWYRCSHCGHAITESNLADPIKRQWVHKFPDHYRVGFQVAPWDVPRYNPLHDILSSIRKYTYADFINFRIGLPFESAENSFMLSVIQRNSVVDNKSLKELMLGGYYGLYIGVDLGKVAHVVVGAASPTGLDVLCAEQVNVAHLQDNHLGKFLVMLYRSVRGNKMVSDAMPDYTVAMYISSMGCGFGAEYKSNPTLDIYHWDEDKGVVKIDRDGHFDDLASAVNSGRVKFPKECSLMSSHLSVMKKAKVETAKGMTEKWTSTSSEDHFAHALGYCWAAYASVNERFGGSRLLLPPSVGKVRLKT